MNADNRVDGAVITFVDIDELKRSIEEIRRSKELSDSLMHINCAAISAADSEEILRRALGESTQALGSDLGLFLLRSDSSWIVGYGEGQARKLEGEEIEERRLPQLASLLREQLPVQVDLGAEVDLGTAGEPTAGITSALGIVSLLLVPLLVDEEFIGAFAFGWREQWVFAGPVVEFTNNLASSVSLWLSRVGVPRQLKKGGGRNQ